MIDSEELMKRVHASMDDAADIKNSAAKDEASKEILLLIDRYWELLFRLDRSDLHPDTTVELLKQRDFLHNRLGLNPITREPLLKCARCRDPVTWCECEEGPTVYP